jgi:hypothetical protein
MGLYAIEPPFSGSGDPVFSTAGVLVNVQESPEIIHPRPARVLALAQSMVLSPEVNTLSRQQLTLHTVCRNCKG